MPWPFRVVRQFEKIPVNPSKNDFMGAYNKLLHSLFPPETSFTVFPRCIPPSREFWDALVLFKVLLEDKPVLILALHPPADLRYPSRREAADSQIRSRIRDMFDDCPNPTLYAVSAMGTQVCFLTKRAGEPIDPWPILRDSAYETDTAPRERWNYDIMEEAGETKFREMVEEIMQAYNAV